MKLHMKNFAVEVPSWLVLVGLLVADSMWTNHCRKKSFKDYVEAVKES